MQEKGSFVTVCGTRQEKRPPIREAHKRQLTSSSASTKQVKKRVRKTKENFEQVPAENSRPETEETSPGKPVPDLQEDQCKPRRDQSGPEETNSVDQARTTSIIVDSRDNKVARSLRRVQEAEGQHH
ncbi:hypothetical protein TNCV_3298291 [Trichonephila clavipes]|uniref:Uncharacterized protein n=1 Tax=Trichonephila clavipes TaxID=2585209 RepID=A0A8X7B7D4_TRICX|nr:hypothetical protein TNCV_3298291 [Trichonephila clavipes]